MLSQKIKIIGTSHISKDSIKEVKEAIEEYNPDIIALELDPLRFKSLISRKQKRNFMKEIKHMGFGGLILNLIGSWIERKLGKRVNVAPGSEMKIAIKLAIEKKKEISLIDQDIRITLKKLTKEVKLKEKFKIFLDILKVPFVNKRLNKEFKEIDLSKVPDQKTIDKIIYQTKKRYPGLYKILIDDRNKVIAKNLYKLRKEHKGKKILAIIGAGHKRGVEKLLLNGNK